MKQPISPSGSRNLPPLLEQLRLLLPDDGRVLEIASGPGQHLIAYAKAFPKLKWQGSDVDPRAFASIDAWCAEEALENVRPPLVIDASDANWSKQVDAPLAAVIVVNMCHISPWEATVGLVGGAAKALSAGGSLLIYGPFKRDGAHTAPSNAQFDASLRAQNPAWGVRSVEEINAVAQTAGLAQAEWYPMPSNNAVLSLRKR